jgi:hypothetical protein
MITCYENHSGAAFGMTQYAANHVGMALFPAPFILLYLPCVDDIAHEIKGVTGVMFEEIVEPIGLAVSSAQMHVGNEYASIGMWRHNII